MAVGVSVCQVGLAAVRLNFAACQKAIGTAKEGLFVNHNYLCSSTVSLTETEVTHPNFGHTDRASCDLLSGNVPFFSIK